MYQFYLSSLGPHAVSLNAALVLDLASIIQQLLFIVGRCMLHRKNYCIQDGSSNKLFVHHFKDIWASASITMCTWSQNDQSLF